MNVILCEDVDNLGSMGDQVKVANGYARNFLLPRQLAVVADSANAKQIEHELRIIRKREVKVRAEMEEVAKTIASVEVKITQKAGENGKLFGSVTSLHIAQALAEQGHEVNRRKIKLSEPIKAVGKYDIVLGLSAGVETTIKLEVIADIVKAEEVEEVAEVDLDDDDDVSTLAQLEAVEAASPKRVTPPAKKEEAEEATDESPAADVTEEETPAEEPAE
jgi:large subunit ribosomal protein L9